MTDLIDAAALICTAAGLLVGALAMVRTRQLTTALPCVLDLFTAAGMLRLTGATSWEAPATAGGILLIRHLVSRGLRQHPWHLE
jgi:hypothetical protein